MTDGGFSCRWHSGRECARATKGSGAGAIGVTLGRRPDGGSGRYSHEPFILAIGRARVAESRTAEQGSTSNCCADHHRSTRRGDP